VSATVATVAFGSPYGAGWGCVWSGAGTIAVLDGHAAALALTSDGPGAWALAGGDTALRVEVIREPVAVGDVSAQACRVQGSVAGATVGWPGVWIARPAPERFDSLRQVLAWFQGGEAAALDAERPARARAHEHDRIRAALLGPQLSAPVHEGRLSTTYGPEGQVARIGLELWLEDEEQHPFAHRLAGEVSGRALACDAGALTLELAPLRTHYSGSDGAGAVLVARAS
jgi:hypothetical protein